MLPLSSNMDGYCALQKHCASSLFRRSHSGGVVSRIRPVSRSIALGAYGPDVLASRQSTQRSSFPSQLSSSPYRYRALNWCAGAVYIYIYKGKYAWTCVCVRQPHIKRCVANAAARYRCVNTFVSHTHVFREFAAHTRQRTAAAVRQTHTHTYIYIYFHKPIRTITHPQLIEERPTCRALERLHTSGRITRT